MWDEEEQNTRKAKKIRRIGRSGAYGLGGGIGLWFMNSIYPYEEGAEKMAELFGYIAMVLLFYGVVTLASIIFKRKLVTKINMLMVWFIIPTAVIMIFSKFWSG